MSNLREEGYVSINDLTCRMFHHQCRLSERRNHPPPNYTLSELREWVFSQDNFDELYKAWKQSGFDMRLTPSCDRLDDYKPYRFDNMRLTTWEVNKRKGTDDAKNGVNNKHNKAVNQLNMDGELIETHHSMRHASRVTGACQSAISKCCRGDYKSTGGFRWEYAKTDNDAVTVREKVLDEVKDLFSEWQDGASPLDCEDFNNAIDNLRGDR